MPSTGIITSKISMWYCNEFKSYSLLEASFAGMAALISKYSMAKMPNILSGSAGIRKFLNICMRRIIQRLYEIHSKKFTKTTVNSFACAYKRLQCTILVVKTTARTHSHHYTSILYLVLLALLLYIIVPQLDAFKQSIPLLRDASLHWFLLAGLASLGAHVAAGFKYMALALKRVRVFPTVLVQLASLLVNRILPVGIGGIGVNYLYLYKAKHTKLEAGVVVTMNNLVGFVGHMLLVAWLLAVAPDAAQLHFSTATLWLVYGLLAVMLLVVILLHSRFNKAARKLMRSLRQYATKPVKIVLATGWSVVIAALYAVCLYYSALALNVHISFIQALVVLTLGVAASTVSPTPGGLVGVEAALVGGLIAYKVPSAEALAVALLFRLITYWFALLLGALAFVYARKAKYL